MALHDQITDLRETIGLLESVAQERKRQLAELQKQCAHLKIKDESRFIAGWWTCEDCGYSNLLEITVP